MTISVNDHAVVTLWGNGVVNTGTPTAFSDTTDAPFGGTLGTSPVPNNQKVTIVGAGVSGADLQETSLTYVDNSHVTLGVGASTSVSNASWVWGSAVGETNGNSLTQLKATYTVATSLHDTIVLLISFDPGQTITSTPTDTAGNTYVLKGTYTGSIYKQALYYVVDAKASSASSNMVTVQFSGAVPSFSAIEYYLASGLDNTSPIDQYVTNSGTGVTSTSGTWTTTSANELELAFCGPNTHVTAGAGGGWTLTNADPLGNASQYQIVSTIQTGVNVSFTQFGSGGAYDITVVTLKAAATVASPSPTLNTQQRVPGFPPRAPIPGIGLLGKGILLAPTNTTSTVNIYPAGLNSLSDLGAVSISPSILPAGMFTEENLGSSTNTFTISPAGLKTEENLGSSTTTIQLSPAGLKTEENLGSSTNTFTISPSGMSTEEVEGTILLSTHPPPFILQTQSRVPGFPLGAPIPGIALLNQGILATQSLNISSTNIYPSGIDSLSDLGAQSNTFSILAAGVSNQENFGALSNTPSLALSGVATAEQYGSIQLFTNVYSSGFSTQENSGASSTGISIQPANIDTKEQSGASAMSISIQPANIDTKEQSGASSINYSFVPIGISTQEVLGSSTNTFQLVPSGLSTEEKSGNNTLTVSISSSGINTDEKYGAANFAANITLSGIKTEESVGQLTLTNTILSGSINTEEKSGAQIFTPSIQATGINNSEIFGNQSTSINLSIIGIDTESKLGASNLSPNITHAGIATEEKDGSSNLTNSIFLSGISTEEKMGSQTPTITLQSAGIFDENRSSFGQIVANITHSGIISEEKNGTSSLTPNINYSGFSTQENSGSSTTQISLFSPTIITAEDSGSMALESFQNAIYPLGVNNEEKFGAFTTGLNLYSGNIYTEEKIGASTTTVALNLSGIKTDENIGSSLTTINLKISGISSEEKIGSFSPSLSLFASNIPTQESLGASVQLVTAFIHPSNIDSNENIGASTVSANIISSSIITTENNGSFNTTINILPGTINTEERLGTSATLVTAFIQPASIFDETGKVGGLSSTGNSLYLSGIDPEDFGAFVAQPNFLPANINTEEQFGASTQSSVISISSAGIITEENIGSFTTTISLYPIHGSGIETENAVGNNSTLITLNSTGLNTFEDFGSVAALSNQMLTSPSGIITEGNFGSSVLIPIFNIFGSSISDSSIFGNSRIYFDNYTIYSNPRLPPAIIFINGNINYPPTGPVFIGSQPNNTTSYASVSELTTLQTQLFIDDTMTKEEFDARVKSDPNYPVIIHLQKMRILVILPKHLPFCEIHNLNLADVVLFLHQGLADIEKNHWGPPRQNFETQRLTIYEILRAAHSHNVVTVPAWIGFAEGEGCDRCHSEFFCDICHTFSGIRKCFKCGCGCKCFCDVGLIDNQGVRSSPIHLPNCDNIYNNPAFIRRK